jgi:hypothetical protein
MIVLRILVALLLISFSSAASPYFVFKENGKSGLKNQEGKVVIPAQYDAIGWSDGSFSLLNNVTGYRNGHGWGLINLSNQRITRADYTELQPAESNLIIAAKLLKTSPRNVLGCISLSGKQIIPFIYDGISISSFRAIVFTRIGNQYKYGLIDLENKTLIPQQYQDIKPIGSLRYAVKNFDGKIAVFGENGQAVTGFVIDSLSAFRNNLAIFYQRKFKGVIDRNGSFKIEAKFRDIEIVSDTDIRVKEPDEWSFLSSDNKLIRKVLADSVVPLAPNLFKVSIARQAQMVDGNFSPVGNSILTDIGVFKSGKALYQLGNFYGVILQDGKVLIPAMYNQVLVEKEFILASQKNASSKSWILFDSLGNRKINRAYESVRPVSSKFFVVQHHGFYGVINSSGREVVACAYDSILDSRGQNLLVKFKGLYGVINVSEEWRVAPRSNRITLMDDEKFLEHSPTSIYLKERTGNVIYFSSNKLQPHGDYLLEYLPSGAIWKISLDGLIVDRQVMPAEATEAVYEESEGYRAIKRNGKFGFIDSRGRLRIANRYEDIQPFREGLAAVKILGKWGFINVQDNIAIQPVYDEVKPFHNGFAHVKQKGLFGLIDRRGKLVLPVRYQSIKVLDTKNLLIRFNGANGLADATGRILVQPKYDFLLDTGNGFVVVARENKYGVIGHTGVSTIPVMYDYITFDKYSQSYLALKKSKWESLKIQ